MRHKHADLIHAWAEGADIEMRSEFTYPRWIPVTLPSPQFAEDREYRIKPPEKKPDVVSWLALNYPSQAGWFESSAPLGSDCIKITRDGETGKLKSAEVL